MGQGRRPKGQYGTRARVLRVRCGVHATPEMRHVAVTVCVQRGIARQYGCYGAVSGIRGPAGPCGKRGPACPCGKRGPAGPTVERKLAGPTVERKLAGPSSRPGYSRP